MPTKFSQLELNQKIEAFNDLETVSEKLEFWEQEINIDYVDFTDKFDAYPQLHPFIICPPIESPTTARLNTTSTKNEDWRKLNTWLIEHWDNDSCKTKLLQLTDLKRAFDIEIKTTDNKEEKISLELKRVDESFLKLPPSKFSLSGLVVNFEFQANEKQYNDYLKYKIRPDYSIIPPGVHTIWVANAVTLADYRNYVANLEKKQPIKSNNVTKETKLSNNQLALLLEYTGILDVLDCDNTVKARLFSSLLNVSYKNLYDCLREVKSKKSKNVNDLTAVYNFIQENKLNSLAKNLKTDLDKLKKNL